MLLVVVTGDLRIQLEDDQEVLIETVTTAHTGDVVVDRTVPLDRQLDPLT